MNLKDNQRNMNLNDNQRKALVALANDPGNFATLDGRTLRGLQHRGLTSVMSHRFDSRAPCITPKGATLALDEGATPETLRTAMRHRGHTESEQSPTRRSVRAIEEALQELTGLRCYWSAPDAP